MDPDFFAFKTVYIEKTVKDLPSTRHIMFKISGNPAIEYVDSLKEMVSSQDPVYHPRDRAQTLYLGSIRGQVVQSCPGSHGHLCCNYNVINQVVGCPIDCSYCILQAYLNQPSVVINTDIETTMQALRMTMKSANGYVRIGTGELGDSLVYDELTGFSKTIIETVSEIPNCIFEFKTKTTSIQSILNIPAPGNVVIGFSLNPPSIAEQEEGYAASVADRIMAAAQCMEAGYRVSFHFDPMIFSDSFEQQYSILVNDLFEAISPEAIAWISMGTFRYTKDLKSMMEYNYPDSKLLLAEFSVCNDGKFRYFYPLRQRMYRSMYRWIKNAGKQIPIYLCMESPRMWQEVMGHLPHENMELNFIFKRWHE